MTEPRFSSKDGRFPASGRRRVANLAPVQRYSGPFFLALYVLGAAVAAPFVLRWPGWYTNDGVTDAAFYFCIAILCLPIIGFVVGFRLLRRCTTVAFAAQRVDRRTQLLFDDHATLQSSARETLAADYDKNAKTQDAIVEALKADALRRAFVDRWEPSSWLVDAQWTELSKGLPLIGTLQRVALQLGILFTFIGLAVAFQSDAFQKSGAVSTIPDMQPLMTALQVKFMASIAGLISSIALIGLGWACRRELGNAVGRLEAMVDNILTLAKTMRSDPHFASDITQLRESVQRLDSRIDGLAEGYAQVVATIRDGIADLARTRSAFEDRIADLLHAQSRVIGEIESFYKMTSPQGLAEHLGDMLNSNMEGFAKRLDTTSQSVDQLNDAVVRLAAAERRRAQDDSSTADRHAELIGALRALKQRPAWGTPSERKPTDRGAPPPTAKG